MNRMKNHKNDRDNTRQSGESQGLLRPKDSDVLQLREFIRNLNNKIDRIENEKKALEKRVELLERRIDENQGKTIEALPEKIDKEEVVQIGETIVLDVKAEEKPEEVIVEIETHDEQPQQREDVFEWIYFGTPENGCFRVTNQKKSGESNICYRINVKTLEIEYVHSKLDSRWISYRNECLLPVCDIVNNVSSASSVKMEQPGKVVKQGENYVIDPKNKIKIKLL